MSSISRRSEEPTPKNVLNSLRRGVSIRLVGLGALALGSPALVAACGGVEVRSPIGFSATPTAATTMDNRLTATSTTTRGAEAASTRIALATQTPTATETPNVFGTMAAEQRSANATLIASLGEIVANRNEPTATQVPTETQAPAVQATEAPTATAEPAKAEATEVPAKAETGNETLNVSKYPVPTEFNPNVDDHRDGKSVHNHTPDAAPLGQWYYLAFPSSHGEFEVDGKKAFVDDYGITWLQDGTNVKFQSHGMPGEVVAQVVDNQEQAEIVMGFKTQKEYTDANGHTTGIFMKKMDIQNGKEYQDSPAQVSFKGAAPERPIFVYNEKGELIAKGETSYAGDITISLPDEGQVFVKMADIHDTTTGTLEVEITAGPDVYYHDQKENPQNRIDVSGYKPRG